LHLLRHAFLHLYIIRDIDLPTMCAAATSSGPALHSRPSPAQKNSPLGGRAIRQLAIPAAIKLRYVAPSPFVASSRLRSWLRFEPFSTAEHDEADHQR
jgi:hypothetical protein